MSRKHPNPLIHEIHTWVEKDLWLAYKTICAAKGSNTSRDIRKLIRWRVDSTMKNVLNQTQDVKAPPLSMFKGPLPK